MCDPVDMSDVPSWLADARSGWANTGAARPAFAHEPGPGQESVWDYPRPPRLEPVTERLRVFFAGETVGIPGPVEPLMVVPDQRQHGLQTAQG